MERKEAVKIAKIKYGVGKDETIDENGKIFNFFNKHTNFLNIAKKFIKINPYYYDENKLWWRWNHKEYMWEKVDEVDLINDINNRTKEPSVDFKGKIINALMQVARENKPEENKPCWIQFKNIIIDLENDERFEATPKYFITNPIPHYLGETIDTPTIDKLFSSWVGQDRIDSLYEALSFCLIPKYIIHRVKCYIGSGSNGKSTFFNLMRKFLGDYNVTSVNLQLLLKGRFEGRKLYKKLVAIMGETSFTTISQTEFFKALTGEDLIRVEYKGIDGFDATNYAKIFIATNSLPQTTDKTEGWYRRWDILDFIGKFKKEEDVLNKIPDEEWENLSFKCSIIAKRLWKDRKFLNEESLENRKRIYEEKSNPIMLFINKHYVKDNQARVEFAEFYNDLMDFLEIGGFRILSSKAVSQQLKYEGFDTEKKNVSNSTTKTTFILGISKKEENRLSPLSPNSPVSYYP